jgi:hypothetical protein
MPKSYSAYQSESKTRSALPKFGDPPKEGEKTLNEPVLTTLQRDLLSIYYRTKIIFTPVSPAYRMEAMGNYDLWGPGFYFIIFSL